MQILKILKALLFRICKFAKAAKKEN